MRLYQRKKNGLWYIEFRRGKALSLHTKDPAIAQRAFKELEKKSLRERLHILDKDELKLFSAFIAEYKEFRKDRAPNTQRADALALQKLLDYYGDRPMVGLTAKVIEKFRTHLFALKAERSKAQVLPNTVNNWIRHLRGALKTAMRWGYLPSFSGGPESRDKRTPTIEPLKIYKVDLRKKIPASEAEILKLLETAKKIEPCMETAMAIQYYSALGRAEICGTIVITDGTLSYRRKKTDKLRTIKISDALRPYLAHLAPGIHKIVPWESVDTYSHKFTEIAEKAGLDISTHSLRHCFATHSLNRGARLEDVSELMDHSSPDITKRFYGHISDDRLGQTINLLNLKRKA